MPKYNKNKVKMTMINIDYPLKFSKYLIKLVRQLIFYLNSRTNLKNMNMLWLEFFKIMTLQYLQ